MARPRIVEVDYFPFQQALRRAIAVGERIEPTEKARWEQWVREHRVREAAFKSFGSGKYEGLSPVIIDTEGQWRGYYLVSTREEVCLKWAREEGDS